MAKAVAPTLDALRARGITYRGVLYAGIMLTPDGPKILEYNVRFGDPECQVVLPRLASDLAGHLAEAAAGKLATPVRWSDDACVTVVLAAEDYPAAPRTGDVITGLAEAGARARRDRVPRRHQGQRPAGQSHRRRTGPERDRHSAPTLPEARSRAYEAAALISWPGLQHRTDIAAGGRRRRR